MTWQPWLAARVAGGAMLQSVGGAAATLRLSGDTLFDGLPKPIYTGIRGTRYKYVEHHACDPELYDLENDPYELNNLYAQSGEETRSQLDAWLRVMESRAADSCRAFEMGPPSAVNVPLVLN